MLDASSEQQLLLLGQLQVEPGVRASRYNLWYVGMLLALAASFVGALGDNLVRYAHRAEKTTQRTMGIWALGLGLTAIGNSALTLWALAYADASLIVPFAGVHVVFAVFLATVINDEKIGVVDILSILVILAGILTTVLSANKESVDYDLDHLVALLSRQPFLITVSGILWVAVASALVAVRSSCTRKRPAIAASAAAILCGTMGGLGTVACKAGVEAVKASIRGGNVSPQAWMILVSTATVALLQLATLNYALSKFKASLVVPIILATLTVMGTGLGVIFFEEYKRFSRKVWFTLPLGIIVACAGIVLLTYHTHMNSSKPRREKEATFVA